MAAAAFDEYVIYVGTRPCYNHTDAANLVIKELKSKFKSYRTEVYKAPTLAGGARKALRKVWKGRQAVFAATKRALHYSWNIHFMK